MIRPAPRPPAGRSLCHSLLFPFAKAADAYAAPAASVLSAPRRKLPLDEWADGWYTEGNNRQGAYTDMIKNLIHLPRQYPKKPRKSLLYQWFSSLKRRLLHHNYTICERVLMWQRPRHGMNTRKKEDMS